MFTKKHRLLRHIHGVHEGKNMIKDKQCHFCDKKFKNNVSRTQHEDTIHRNIRKLKCDKCEFSTNRTTQLRIHKESIHDGIIYECNQLGCVKSYNLKKNLDAHKWTSHKIPLPMAKKKEVLIMP